MTLTYKSARVSKVHDKGDDRTVSGIITRESVDEDGEVVLADGLNREYNDKLSGVSILWNHDTDKPVGKLRSLAETVGGWMASCKLANTERGTEALALAREGILHFSIGFARIDHGKPTQEERAKYPGVKYITRKWNLMELTLTPVPAHSDANVVSAAMKSMVGRGLIGQKMLSEFSPGPRIDWHPDLVVPDIGGLDLTIPEW